MVSWNQWFNLSLKYHFGSYREDMGLSAIGSGGLESTSSSGAPLEDVSGCQLYEYVD